MYFILIWINISVKIKLKYVVRFEIRYNSQSMRTRANERSKIHISKYIHMYTFKYIFIASHAFYITFLHHKLCLNKCKICFSWLHFVVKQLFTKSYFRKLEYLRPFICETWIFSQQIFIARGAYVLLHFTHLLFYRMKIQRTRDNHDVKIK